jgi:predicted polyphosphate/ATP-dependent NAD kinase
LSIAVIINPISGTGGRLEVRVVERSSQASSCTGAALPPRCI